VVKRHTDDAPAGEPPGQQVHADAGPEPGHQHVVARPGDELGDRFLLRGAVGSRHDHGGDRADRPVEGACRCHAGSFADPARFMPRRRVSKSR
jgi:hypothetical protein